MIEVTDAHNIRMSGDETQLLFEIAQILVSYQYILDSVDNGNKHSESKLFDTIAEILMVALHLYTDEEYIDILDQAESKVVDATDLRNVLQKLRNES
jgi:hypothetical protein